MRTATLLWMWFWGVVMGAAGVQLVQRPTAQPIATDWSADVQEPVEQWPEYQNTTCSAPSAHGCGDWYAYPAMGYPVTMPAGRP